jgi:hypothetical protein
MIYLIGTLSTIAWVWLIVIAFKESQTVWGVAMILLIPSCFLYGILNWSKVSIPFILLVISIGLMFSLSPEQLAQLE